MGRGQAGGHSQNSGGRFLLVERADWPAAIHLRSDRDGELRYSSYVPVGDRLTTWSGRQEVPKPASSASGSRTGGRQPGTNKRKPNLVRPTGKEEAEIAAQLAEDPDTYEWTEEDWANAQTTQELFPEAHEWAVRQKEALKDGFIQWGDRHPGPGDDSLVQGPDGGGWEHRRDAVDGAVAQTLRDHAHGGRKSEA